MGLFSRHAEPTHAHPPPPTTVEQPRSSGLFGRHHHQPAPAVVEQQPRRSSGGSSGGFFGRRRSLSPPSSTASSRSSTSTRRHRSVLHSRGAEDPSIVAARERVYAAEAAERTADKALMGAKAAVRDAREHVKRLEHEAAEDARLAVLKQNQAKSISKRAKPLGRHDRI